MMDGAGVLGALERLAEGAIEDSLGSADRIGVSWFAGLERVVDRGQEQANGACCPIEQRFLGGGGGGGAFLTPNRVRPFGTAAAILGLELIGRDAVLQQDRLR
jgi:hypothetical protein